MLHYLDTIIAFVVILLGVSLLITILNQMISALLGYRGTNLLWGIRTLLSSIEPGLTQEAEKIATDLLRKPIISHSIFSKLTRDGSLLGWLTKRWKLATGITSQELVHGLSNVARTIAATSGGKPTADLINGVLAQVDPEANRNAKMVLETLQNLSPNTPIQMDKLIQELVTASQGSIGKVEVYFDAVMKRASHRFTTQMRIWTIVFSVLLAFGAQLDSIEIFNRLWNSSELRDRLMSDRETLLREASLVLSVQGGTAQGAGPGVPSPVLREAMKDLKAAEKEATAALGDARDFASLDEALNWLRENLRGDEALKKKLADEYRKFVLARLPMQAGNIRQDLAKSGFQLQIVTSWDEFRKLFDESRLLGILATAALLSLGAPFWFNTLRSLSNLRPLIAPATTKTPAGSTPA
jgi:hypothetical protein